MPWVDCTKCGKAKMIPLYFVAACGRFGKAIVCNDCYYPSAKEYRAIV